MEDNNHWLAKGHNYLIEVHVPEELDEGSRHRIEGELLHSIYKGSAFDGGLKVVALYKADFTIEEKITSLKNDLIQQMQQAVVSITPKQIDPPKLD